MTNQYAQPTREELNELPVFSPNVSEEDMKLMTFDGQDEPVFYKVFTPGKDGELLPPFATQNGITYKVNEWWPLHIPTSDDPDLCVRGMIHITTNPEEWFTRGSVVYRVLVKNVQPTVPEGKMACEILYNQDKYIVSTGRTVGEPLTLEEMHEINTRAKSKKQELNEEYQSKREEIIRKEQEEREKRRVKDILEASAQGKIYVDQNTDFVKLAKTLFSVCNCPHCGLEVKGIEYEVQESEMVYRTKTSSLTFHDESFDSYEGDHDFGDFDSEEIQLQYDCGCSIHYDDFDEILVYGNGVYNFEDMARDYMRES